MLGVRIPSHHIPTSTRLVLQSLCPLQSGRQSHLLTQRLNQGNLLDGIVISLQRRSFRSALGCVNRNTENSRSNLTSAGGNERFGTRHSIGPCYSTLSSISPLTIPISPVRCSVGAARFSTLQFQNHRFRNEECRKTALRPSATAVLLSSPVAIQSSFFSTRGKRGNKYKNKKGDDGKPDLMNEKLISVLLKNQNATADEVQVRLVVDQGQSQPSQIDIVSLSSAIDTSSELGVDLVGINIKQDPPVIKAVDVSKLIYAKNKKSQGSGGGGSSGTGTKQTKTYKFKAGIHENDLSRKAENVIKYLSKGHPIQITITSNNFQLRADKDAVITTLERVREVVGDHAVEAHNVRKNAQGSFATIVFQPNKKRSSKGK